MKKRGRGSKPAAPITKRERVKGKVTTPVAVMILNDLVGVTKAAEFIGVSTTKFHKARRDRQVSVETEVAARGVLQEMGIPLADYGIAHVAAIPMDRYVLRKTVAAPVPVLKRQAPPKRPQPAPQDDTMYLGDTANDKMLDAMADKLMARLLKRG